MLSTDLKTFIINWNNLFPLDRWYREKYKIPFNSKKHLKASQVDILLEYIEEISFKEYSDDMISDIENKKLLDKGEWLKPTEVTEKESDDLFDAIEI